MTSELVLDKPYHNLKGIIVSKGLKQNDIADKLGMDKSTLSMKINRYKGRDFTFSEASKLADLLGVKMEDFQQYFFTLKVAKTTTKGERMRPKRYPFSGKIKTSTTEAVKAWEDAYSEEGSNIPNMFNLTDCLRKAIRKRAMQQKTPNHKNQVLEQEEKLMEKIIAYSVEELFKKVAEQEKRISEIEMRLGIKPLEEISS